MTQFNQIQYKCHVGVDYPSPIIPPIAYNSSGIPGSNRIENGVVAPKEKHRKHNRVIR
jgi:hypothetical protein